MQPARKTPPRPMINHDLADRVQQLADTNHWTFTIAVELLLAEALEARTRNVDDE